MHKMAQCSTRNKKTTTNDKGQRLCFLETAKEHTAIAWKKKNKIQMVSFITFPSQLIESRRPREKSLSHFFNNIAFICEVSTYR